jgi:hypothetical protein
LRDELELCGGGPSAPVPLHRPDRPHIHLHCAMRDDIRSIRSLGDGRPRAAQGKPLTTHALGGTAGNVGQASQATRYIFNSKMAKAGRD